MCQQRCFRCVNEIIDKLIRDKIAMYRHAEAASKVLARRLPKIILLLTFSFFLY
jgi:hypothetical protein